MRRHDHPQGRHLSGGELLVRVTAAQLFEDELDPRLSGHFDYAKPVNVSLKVLMTARGVPDVMTMTSSPVT